MRWTLLVVLLAGCAQPLQVTPLTQAEVPCLSGCDIVVAADPWWGWEPSIAIDPLDPQHLVLGIHDDPWAASPYWSDLAPEVLPPGLLRMSAAVSWDAGSTWEKTFLPYAADADPGSAWGVMCNQGDPVVQFGPDGRLWMFGIGLGCSDGNLLTAASYLWASESLDGGFSWQEPTFVWQGFGTAVQFIDKPWAAIDPDTGRMAVTWTAFSAVVQVASLMVAVSDDGETWSVPEALTHNTEVGLQGLDNAFIGDGLTNHYSMPVFGVDGRIHIASRGCSRQCLLVASGSPGDWSVTEVARMVRPLRSAVNATGEPVMALTVDRDGPRPGRLYLVYPDAFDDDTPLEDMHGEPVSDLDIVARWSDDGQDWSEPMLVSVPDGDDQFHPWAEADGGRLHLFYLDRVEGRSAVQATYGRYDLATGNVSEVHLDAPWEPNPAQGTWPGIGHYEGLDTWDGNVALAWTRVVAPKDGQEAFSDGLGFDRDIHAAYLTRQGWAAAGSGEPASAPAGVSARQPPQSHPSTVGLKGPAWR